MKSGDGLVQSSPSVQATSKGCLFEMSAALVTERRAHATGQTTSMFRRKKAITGCTDELPP